MKSLNIIPVCLFFSAESGGTVPEDKWTNWIIQVQWLMLCYRAHLGLTLSDWPVLVGESTQRFASSHGEVHSQERSPRLNTVHSAARHHLETSGRCLTSSPNRTHFFHQLCQRKAGGGGKTSKYYTCCLLASALSKFCQRRMGNFRVLRANTNNCSGEASLSALEVWVKCFNAL